MSEKAQQKIDGEYGRLIFLINQAFGGYRQNQDAQEIEPLLHEAYLLIAWSTNYHKPYMARRNALLKRIRRLYPEWKDEQVHFHEQ